MRDILLGTIIAWLALRAIIHPWIGILAWTWIGIMNPHAYGWLLNTMPVAMTLAIAIFIGTVITGDRRKFFVTPESGALIAFMVWMTIATTFSFFFESSFVMWKRVMKIDMMILLAMVVLHSKKHIIMLAAVASGSVAFYGVKGGIFTIATGGSYRVWGPDTSFIEGNNELALALIMSIPLLRFLQLSTTSKWVARGLLASMALCSVAAIGSHSRGALLAIAAMTVFMWWRSEKKLGMGIVMGFAGIATIAFMPAHWMARMESISNYSQDSSALGRINAWYMAWNLASTNFFGGGYEIYWRTVFSRYAPDPDDVHAAHSIYFQVLGEHGFVGLLLFLLMWALVWFSAGRLMRDGRLRPETKWASDLGAMCQVSLVGYATGGGFLSLAYFDLPYNILVLVVLANRWCKNKEWVVEDAAEAALAKARAGAVGNKKKERFRWPW